MDAEATTIDELLRRATTTLAASSSPRLDAELLLAHCLARPRSYLYAHAGDRPDAARRAAFADLIRRRASGEPVAYLTGRREFWSLDLEVHATTLIPRPDTERLVEAALEHIDARKPVSVADLGTGSGAVALAIASERPVAEVWASDLSEGAVAVARRNRDRLGLANVHLVSGTWYAAFPDGQRFDVIVSNPPYVRAGDPHLDVGDLRFEPVAALVAGADGLTAIRAIANGACARLRPGGWLLVEHGLDQSEAVRELFTAGGLAAVETRNDLEGRPRVTLGTRA